MIHSRPRLKSSFSPRTPATQCFGNGCLDYSRMDGYPDTILVVGFSVISGKNGRRSLFRNLSSRLIGRGPRDRRCRSSCLTKSLAVRGRESPYASWRPLLNQQPPIAAASERHVGSTTALRADCHDPRGRRDAGLEPRERRKALPAAENAAGPAGKITACAFRSELACSAT